LFSTTLILSLYFWRILIADDISSEMSSYAEPKIEK